MIRENFHLWGLWTVDFENGGSVDHCGKNWGEAASLGRRLPIFVTPPLRIFMTPSLMFQFLEQIQIHHAFAYLQCIYCELLKLFESLKLLIFAKLFEVV